MNLTTHQQHVAEKLARAKERSAALYRLHFTTPIHEQRARIFSPEKRIIVETPSTLERDLQFAGFGFRGLIDAYTDALTALTSALPDNTATYTTELHLRITHAERMLNLLGNYDQSICVHQYRTYKETLHDLLQVLKKEGEEHDNDRI